MVKRYLPPETPYERALVHPSLDEAFKHRLREIYRSLDPLALLAQMRDAQNELGKRVDRRAGMSGMTAAPVRSDVVAFARELGDGWNAGEQRIIHRRRYVRRKPVPRRPSMLDPTFPSSRNEPRRFRTCPRSIFSPGWKRMRPVGSGGVSGVRCSGW
ncbi:hypothetical protein IVB22_34715 [Bradyrhizobium sp. 190]|uniref:hypothetical protein n=1 Tax=Bradyrhizobium sp. 190 TaxID=2782658 RepID=UPI001FF9174E|nr:hypothetical protein [Bradyrhizobium sp. 190]MCK1517547.1 hypothetical protein [Bradyrhizobium sp. 190]